jgi:hypothetical protein
MNYAPVLNKNANLQIDLMIDFKGENKNYKPQTNTIAESKKFRHNLSKGENPSMINKVQHLQTNILSHSINHKSKTLMEVAPYAQ